MNARLLLNSAAIVEVLIGLALLVAPLFVIGLLLGDGLGLTGAAVARVLGIALLAVGVAGWQSPGQDTNLAPRTGLCVYNVGVAALLMYLGTTGGMNGPFLWPVAALHGLIGSAMLSIISARLRNNNNV